MSMDWGRGSRNYLSLGVYHLLGTRMLYLHLLHPLQRSKQSKRVLGVGATFLLHSGGDRGCLRFAHLVFLAPKPFTRHPVWRSPCGLCFATKQGQLQKRTLPGWQNDSRSIKGAALPV